MSQDNPNDDFTKELIQFLHQLIPYFIMGQIGEVNPIYLIFLPILVRLTVKLGSKIKNYIFQRKDNNEHFIQYFSQNDTHYDNKVFTILNWYLSNHMNELKIMQLMCDRYDYLEYGKTKFFDKIDAIYGLIHKKSDNHYDNPEILYTYKNVKLRIVPSINSHKSIKKTIERNLLTIYAIDLEIIKDFVLHCQNEYQEFARKQDRKYYQYFEWNDDDNKWCGNKIHTNKTFDNIFLEKQLKNDIIKNIDIFIKSKNFYEKVGIPYKKGMIFYGEPGCGKTSTEYAIANHYKRNIYIIRLDELNTSDKLKRAIQRIEEDAIVIFEDIDAHYISHTRTPKNSDINNNIITNISSIVVKDNDKNMDSDSDEDNTDINKMKKHLHKIDKNIKHNKNPKSNKKHKFNWFMAGDGLFQTLLEVMDGYNFLSGAIIIFTTNHIDKLDGALIRPGRIDHKYCFQYPTKENILQIFTFFFEVDMNNSCLNKIIQSNIPNNLSSAELINGIVMPNIENIDNAIKKYVERISETT